MVIEAATIPIAPSGVQVTSVVAPMQPIEAMAAASTCSMDAKYSDDSLTESSGSLGKPGPLVVFGKASLSPW